MSAIPNAINAPTLNPNEVGTAIARRIFEDIPNAQELAQIVEPGIVAILKGVLTQPKSPFNSLDALFAPFTVPGGEPPAIPNATVGSAGNGAASSIAALLDPFLKAPFARAPMPDPDRPPPAIKDAQQSENNFQSDFDAIVKDEPFKTIFGVFRDTGLADWAMQSLGRGNNMLPAALYSPEKVQEIVRKLVRTFVKIYGPALKELIDYVEAEITLSTIRSALAKAIGEALKQLPFAVQSDLRIGSHVHRVLQESYANRYRNFSDIVLERFNENANISELVVIGPSTVAVIGPKMQFNAVPLERLALDPKRDPIFVFKSLRMAMNGVKLNKESWLRADLVDLDAKLIWEIKPTSSLFTGVWQETLYRVTYNVIRRVLREIYPNVKAMPHFLSPGDYWSDPDAQRFGGAKTGVQLLSNIPLGKTGTPAVAFPFQVKAIPGLIGYFVLRGPYLAEFLAVVLFEIRQALKAALQKLKQLREQLGKLAEEVFAMIQVVLDNLGRMLVGLLLFAALCGAIALLWPAAAGGAVAGAVVGATIIIIIIATGAGSRSGATPAAGSSAVTEVNLGGIRVSGVPVDMVPKFLAEVQKQLQSIAGAAIDNFRRASA